MYNDLLLRGYYLDQENHEKWLEYCHDDYTYTVRTTYNDCNISLSHLDEIKQRIKMMEGDKIYKQPKVTRIYQPTELAFNEYHVPFIMHMDWPMRDTTTHYGHKYIKTTLYPTPTVIEEIVYFNASVWENPLLEIV